MARLTVQNPATATGAAKNVYDGAKKALGVIPNMVRVIGNSPAALQGWAQFSGALSTGSLPASTREQLALLIAEYNDCQYCLAAHAAIGSAAGLNRQQVDQARRGVSPDKRAAAALTFAQALLEAHGGVSAADVEAARAAGLSEAELVEVVGAVAVNVFTNYVNRAFAVDLDFPRLEPLAAGVK